MTPGDIVTTARAATIHSVQPCTIRKWVQRGLLNPLATINGNTYYRLADVDEAEHQARKRDTTGRANTRTQET